MNEYVLRITQSAGLEKSITSKRRQLAKKEKELNEIRDNCEHEVVICEKYGMTADKYVYKKCLFCGTESSLPCSFHDSQFQLDVSNFKFKNCSCMIDKFKILKDLFIKITKENPELSIEEILNFIKKDL